MTAARRAIRSPSSWLFLVLVIHIAGLAAVAVHLLTREPAVIVESTQQTQTTVGGRPFAFLDNSKPVVEAFTFAQDNLARIDVLLEPAERPRAYDLHFDLRQHIDGADLRTVTVPASSIRSVQYVPLVFDVVARSRDKRFFLVMSGDAPSEESAVSVWGTGFDGFFDGRLVDPVPLPSAGHPAPPSTSTRIDPVGVVDVAMATYFIPPGGRLGKLRVLADRLDFYKPKWLSTPALEAYGVGAAFWLAGRTLLCRLIDDRVKFIAISSIAVVSVLSTACAVYIF